MMPATLRGIYHNLKESKYTISNSEVVFFFSSVQYMDKFMNGYEKHRKMITQRWVRMVGEKTLNMDSYADILFYSKIEKRGFYVWVKGVELSHEEMVKYAMRKMADDESPNWTVIERPNVSQRLQIMG